jgi:hypothetical protein
VLQILQHGMNERFAGSGSGSRFGRGCYLADDIGKIDQYSTEDKQYDGTGALSTLHKRLYSSSQQHPGQVFYALVLWAALHVYGESLGLMQLIVINTFASIIGGLAPVPGGIGVIEAGLIGGFTAAGIPDQQAIAATFTARMFTAYLPPIWGWLSINWLRHRDFV